MGEAEDNMVRLHHRLNGHEFEGTLGDSEGQGNVLAVHGVTQSQIGFSKVKVKSLSCVQFICDPVDRSLPGSSVHGISQARTLDFLLQRIFPTQGLKPHLLY